MDLPYLAETLLNCTWQDAAGGRPKRFIPFSDGRRDCVGQALAKMNYTAQLAMLLGRFHFELAPEVLSSPSTAPATAMNTHADNSAPRQRRPVSDLTAPLLMCRWGAQRVC